MSGRKKSFGGNSDREAAQVPKLRFPEFRELAEWKEKSGNELFDQINDRNSEPGLPVLAITQEHGAIPRHLIDYHVSVSEKSIESYKVVQIGDFIISLRSFQGGIEYSRYHGICSPAYVILRRREEGSDDYFRHYLKTERFIRILTKNLEGLRDGKMISYSQFSELLLPTPTPAEQHKIANFLSSVDELIAAQARKVDTLKTHKKALMQQLFPREGETQPRLRFPEFQNSGEWGDDSISEIFVFRQGLQVAVEHQFSEGGNGRERFIRIIDVTQSNEPPRFVEVTKDANRISSDDLFMIRYGTPGVISIGYEGIIANNLFQLIFIKPQRHLPYFWYYYLQTKYEEISGLSGSSSMPAISFKALNHIDVKYPLLPEQHCIASCLTTLDTLITTQSQKLETLKLHKQGLMQQLFPSLEEVEV